MQHWVDTGSLLKEHAHLLKVQTPLCPLTCCICIKFRNRSMHISLLAPLCIKISPYQSLRRVLWLSVHFPGILVASVLGCFLSFTSPSDLETSLSQIYRYLNFRSSLKWKKNRKVIHIFIGYTLFENKRISRQKIQAIPIINGKIIS